MTPVSWRMSAGDVGQRTKGNRGHDGASEGRGHAPVDPAGTRESNRLAGGDGSKREDGEIVVL